MSHSACKRLASDVNLRCLAGVMLCFPALHNLHDSVNQLQVEVPSQPGLHEAHMHQGLTTGMKKTCASWQMDEEPSTPKKTTHNQVFTLCVLVPISASQTHTANAAQVHRCSTTLSILLRRRSVHHGSSGVSHNMHLSEVLAGGG